MVTFLVTSCVKTEIDDEKPVIDLSITGAFPLNCDTLYFGEDFTLTLRAIDNVELGSMSIDLHHNFDHHNHSTEITECTFDPIKTPVNPFLLTSDITIPSGKTDYTINQVINISSGNLVGEFDEGDYHFFISLTDKSGWSTQKGLSVKIMKR
jgi:hypothetical protein